MTQGHLTFLRRFLPPSYIDPLPASARAVFSQNRHRPEVRAPVASKWRSFGQPSVAHTLSSIASAVSLANRPLQVHFSKTQTSHVLPVAVNCRRHPRTPQTLPFRRPTLRYARYQSSLSEILLFCWLGVSILVSRAKNILLGVGAFFSGLTGFSPGFRLEFWLTVWVEVRGYSQAGSGHRSVLTRPRLQIISSISFYCLYIFGLICYNLHDSRRTDPRFTPKKVTSRRASVMALSYTILNSAPYDGKLDTTNDVL